MTKSSLLLTLALHVLFLAVPVRAQDATIATNKAPTQVLLACLMKVADILEPVPGQEPQLFTAHARVASLEGGPKELAGLELDLACLAADHVRVAAKTACKRYALARA